MAWYPLGISRARDLPCLADRGSAAGVAVRWVIAGELAGAAITAPAGAPDPWRHAAALEAIHRRIGVLPIRFAIAPGGEAEIRQRLEAGRRHWLATLDRLEGTCEMGVRIVLPGCRPQPAGRPSPGSLAAAYLAQRRARYRREDDLGRQAARVVDGLVERLGEVARDWRRLRSPLPGLVRLAFLVERPSAGRLAQRLAAGDAAEPAADRTLLGPWPPYSFV